MRPLSLSETAMRTAIMMMMSNSYFRMIIFDEVDVIALLSAPEATKHWKFRIPATLTKIMLTI